MTARRKTRFLRPGEEKKHFEMLNLCYNPWGDEEKWKRLYSQEGFDRTKNVLVVEEGEEWIGGVTAWYREALLKNGQKVRVYVAGDGYVLPKHRGKGVYSTFMRAVNKLSQERGASLGVGFVSIYDVPFFALEKYGFADVFYPKTRILVVHPEMFFEFVIKQFREIELLRRFEGMKIKLAISLDTLTEKCIVARQFIVRNGKLHGLSPTPSLDLNEKMDLELYTDIKTLIQSFRTFHLRKKTLFLFLLVGILRKRLKVRFSLRFFRAFMGF